MSDDVDPDQHLRVAKALEQVNALKYRTFKLRKLQPTVEIGCCT